MTSGLVAHPACERHDTGPAHAERRERLWAIEERLRASGLASELERHVSRAARARAPELVHPRAYVEAALARIASGARLLDDGDHARCRLSRDAPRCAPRAERSPPPSA
jgi:acetoin utilization deacetylase AcuC-like enzyme